MKFDKKRLEQVVAEVLEIEDEIIVGDNDFIEEYGADSLKILELLASLEKEFDISIPESELKNFNTLDNIQKVLENIQ